MQTIPDPYLLPGTAGRIGNRQVRRAVARRGLHRRQPLKAGRLITPRVTWPPFDAGLSMELCGTSPDGVQSFRYVHSTAYRVSPRTAVMLANLSLRPLKWSPNRRHHSSTMCTSWPVWRMPLPVLNDCGRGGALMRGHGAQSALGALCDRLLK